jgi:hypothetical protein
MRKFPKPSPLDLGKQLSGLRTHFPDGHGRIRRRILTWTMGIRPTPLSGLYRVDIQLGQGSTPKIWVLEPCLADLATDRRLPHVYEQRPAHLCLYRPAYGEWATSTPLYRTVVPWTSLWLFYFEDWLLTDEWKGGGEHPPTESEPPPTRPPAPKAEPSPSPADQ